MSVRLLQRTANDRMLVSKEASEAKVTFGIPKKKVTELAARVLVRRIRVLPEWYQRWRQRDRVPRRMCCALIVHKANKCEVQIQEVMEGVEKQNVEQVMVQYWVCRMS